MLSKLTQCFDKVKRFLVLYFWYQFFQRFCMMIINPVNKEDIAGVLDKLFALLYNKAPAFAEALVARPGLEPGLF